MAVQTTEIRAGLARRSANDRFKSTFGAWLWGGVAMATVLHFAFLALFPQLHAADVSFDVNELESVELPPEVEIPPPPEQIARPAVPVVSQTELEEDVSIAPTTFDENPVENLPPPPGDASRAGNERAFTPFTVRPEIRDRGEATEIILRHYPRLLRDAGIGGTVDVWVYIDTNGRVQDARVHRSSENRSLDEAALKAARQIEFTPALNRDQKVPVWISVPISFEVR